MLTAFFIGLAKLLGSAGVGTIFGGVMGLFHRKADLKLKELELQEASAQRKHELDMRDKDAAIMQLEFAGKTKVAEVEAAGRVDAEAFKAMGESYKFAEPEKGSWVAAFSSFVRPFISMGYFLITSVGGGYIIYYAFHIAGIKLTGEQLFDLVMFVISWMAFMAGAAIGWWYAMRPGTKMPMPSLR